MSLRTLLRRFSKSLPASIVLPLALLGVLQAQATSTPADPFGSFIPNRGPSLLVSPDLVLVENEVSTPIPVRLMDTDWPTAAMEVIADDPFLLPQEQISITGVAPAWAIRFTPGLNAQGRTLVTFRVTGPGGATVSHSAQVEVVGAMPTVTSSPVPTTVTDGSPVQFSLSAKGSKPLRFQWRLNGVDLPGETNQSMSVAHAQVSNAGAYTVRVSNSFGSVDSAPANLTVITPPVLASQPVDQTLFEGAALSLQVTPGSPGPFLYQWRRNGVNVPGQTNAVFSIAKASVLDSGTYTVLVQSPFGAISSRPALVQVQQPTFLMTDAFEAAPLLASTQGSARTRFEVATIQPGEPAHAGRAPKGSLWIRWIAPAPGVMRMNTTGSNLDTALAVYVGGSLLALTEQASDDDGAAYFTSALAFTAVQGTEYRIAIDGTAFVGGVACLNWAFEPGAVPVPRILQDPFSRVVAPGGFTIVNVVAEGVETYQWERNASDVVGGITPLWRVRQATPQDAGVYQVKLGNGKELVYSEKASIQVGPDPHVGSKDKFLQALILGEPVAQPAAASLGAGMRWKQSPGVAASGFRGTQVFSSVGSTTEVGEPSLCGVIGGASQWFPYTASADGFLTVSTEGSDFDTVLGIFTGPGTDFESLQLLACDNNSGRDGRTSKLRLPVAKGQNYFIGVDGVGGTSGTVQLSYAFEQPARLVSINRAEGGVRFQFAGASGANYQVQASPNLAAWEDLGVTNSTSGQITILDPAGVPRRFYRLLPAP